MNKRFNYFPVSVQDMFNSIDTSGWDKWFETELYNKNNRNWFTRSFTGTENLNKYATIDSKGEGEYTLNIPGYGPDDIEVYFKNDKLIIASNCEECDCKPFNMSYSVNKNVDRDKTEVSVKNGVLTLKVFKCCVDEYVKKIEVK